MFRATPEIINHRKLCLFKTGPRALARARVGYNSITHAR